MNNKKYIFIGKTLFFPKEKIVVVGDMHLGYEESLRQGGLDIPLNMFEEAEKELRNTLDNIKAKYGKIYEIVFLGDIRHSFGFLRGEKEELRKLISFTRKYVENENRIIFIRGNHEKNYKNEKFIDYYIVKDIAFVHGHKDFLEIYDKEINYVVMGHIHPSVVLRDKMKIRREKYKCFLVGKFKKKEFVVLPSFISSTEGVSLSEFTDKDKALSLSVQGIKDKNVLEHDDEISGYNFSIIPRKELENFKVYVCSSVGEDVLSFGKLREM